MYEVTHADVRRALSWRALALCNGDATSYDTEQVQGCGVLWVIEAPDLWFRSRGERSSGPEARLCFTCRSCRRLNTFRAKDLRIPVTLRDSLPYLADGEAPPDPPEPPDPPQPRTALERIIGQE